jgi:hypothetical protein
MALDGYLTNFNDLSIISIVEVDEMEMKEKTVGLSADDKMMLDILSSLTPENRRVYLALGSTLLASQGGLQAGRLERADSEGSHTVQKVSSSANRVNKTG